MDPLAVAPDRLPLVGTDTDPVMEPQVALSYVSYEIDPLAVAPDREPPVGTETVPVMFPHVAVGYVS
jgi:hypothetical protein